MDELDAVAFQPHASVMQATTPVANPSTWKNGGLVMYVLFFQSDNQGNTGRGNFHLAIGAIQLAASPMISTEADTLR